MSTDSDLGRCDPRFAITPLPIIVVLLILLANLSLVGCAACKTKSLRFVILVHRHGDRTPVFDYPRNPYKNHWRGRKGALTKKGFSQLCQMGLTLKSRYRSLLPAGGKYTSRNTRVIISPRKRCAESVGALLKCMTSMVVNGKRKFIRQPALFTKFSTKNDNILLQSKVCPRYDAQMRSYLKRPRRGSDVYNFDKRNVSVYKYISRHSGKKVTNCVQAAELYDTFKVFRDNGLQLPGWARSIFPDRLRKIQEFAALLLTKTPYMKRIKGGKFITNVVSQLLRKRSIKGLTQKIQIYSGHDSSVGNLASAVGVRRQTGILPGYGATLVFELYDTNKGCNDWIVKMVYFRNAYIKIPKKISIPGCKYPCKIGRLRKNVSHVWLTKKQYKYECRLRH